VTAAQGMLGSCAGNCLILRGMGGLDQNRDEFSLKELLNSVANALIDSNSSIEVMAFSCPL